VNVLREYLTRTSTLWILLATNVVVIIIFGAVTDHWNIRLIDEASAPAEVRALLSQMSPEQRTVHAWITATLDVVFPIVLGGFLAGVALRSFHRYGAYLALLPLLAIPMDLLEGVVQILALTDTYDLLVLKSVITPLKLALFTFGLVVALVAGVRWVASQFKAGLGP
jgi:hypothetical protein